MNSRVSTRERLREEYARSVKEFAKKVKGLDASGIPAPHIPIVGDSYDKCSFKIAFIGMETYGWGDMNEFISLAEKSPKDAVTKFEGWFDRGGMVKHNGSATFWGFILSFLAKFYHVDKKELLKKNEDGSYKEILSSIIWGNSNAIERYEVTAKKRGVELSVWKEVKELSKSFDSIDHIIHTAKPKVIFLTYKNVDMKYILQDSDIKKEIPDTKYAYLLKPNPELDYRYYYLREQDTHVFIIPHPTWIGAYSGIGFEPYIDELIRTIESMKIWPRMPEKEEDWKRPEENRSSSAYKNRFIADLAHFLVSRGLVMTGEELQVLFNKNNIKTSYGSKYSEDGGRGIHRVIKLAWMHFHNKGQYQIALDISRAFVGKNLKYTY